MIEHLITPDRKLILVEIFFITIMRINCNYFTVIVRYPMKDSKKENFKSKWGMFRLNCLTIDCFSRHTGSTGSVYREIKWNIKTNLTRGYQRIKMRQSCVFCQFNQMAHINLSWYQWLKIVKNMRPYCECDNKV